MSDQPAKHLQMTILVHCGFQMHVKSCQSMETENGVVKIRYWKCPACGYTEKTIDVWTAR